MTAQEIEGWLGILKEYQPLVKASIPLLEETGKDLLPLLEKAVDTSADLQLRFFERLMGGLPGSGYGMTRDEAIQILVATTSGIVQRGMKK